jgi:peroxiredoxin
MSATRPHPIEPQSLAEDLQNLRQQVASLLSPAIHTRLSTAIDNLVRSRPEAAAVGVGQTAPEFSLLDLAGGTVTLSEQLRAGPVVLTFYRGSWCPYCDLALRAYSKMVPQLHRAGARLIAISPQRYDAAVPNAVEHRALDFLVLSDPDNRVARKYGLVYSVDALMRSVLADFGLDISAVNGAATWDLPVPATFVVAPDGRIRWACVETDYRLRAEPDQIIRALTSST